MKKIYLYCLLCTLSTLSFSKTVNPKSVSDFLMEQNQQENIQKTHPNKFQTNKPWILVGVKSQTLKHYDHWGRLIKSYTVSTAKKGVGEIENTYRTPRGHHTICDKIGRDAEIRTIIYRREVTPWKYSEELHKQYPTKDWILTRILWLCGQEQGVNQGVNQYGEVVDSHQRYIYIHGAGDHVPFGTPTSLGCVRMQNEDVIELFNQTKMDTDIYIDEHL